MKIFITKDENILNGAKMKKLLLFTILILSSVYLSGCASTQGNAKLATINSTMLSKKIVKFKTTKQQILNMYGEPMTKTTNSEGDSKWTYIYNKQSVNAGSFLADAFGAQQESYASVSLIITFNRQNIVINYKLSKTYSNNQ
jgi:outer membrane protein assembly factor BamE (lipoprotein component of BamABCDE complex)